MLVGIRDSHAFTRSTKGAPRPLAREKSGQGGHTSQTRVAQTRSTAKVVGYPGHEDLIDFPRYLAAFPRAAPGAYGPTADKLQPAGEWVAAEMQDRSAADTSRHAPGPVLTKRPGRDGPDAFDARACDEAWRLDRSVKPQWRSTRCAWGSARSAARPA